MTIPETVIHDWFIDQYHCDALSEALNSGANEVPEWTPHVGHHAQANANAEVIIKQLREAGYVISPAEGAVLVGDPSYVFAIGPFGDLNAANKHRLRFSGARKMRAVRLTPP